MKLARGWYWLALALLGSLPWLTLRVLDLAGISHPITVEQHPLWVALFSGTGILCAAFLVAWAAEVAQMDVSQALAVAALALIAVLPEYAVDMYFAWQAGRHPGGEHGHYAIANMTGANRLLVGLAWAAVVFVFWARTRNSAIVVETGRRLELAFLAMATAYSFVIPLKASIGLVDAIVFVGLFIWYMSLAARSARVEPELVGPPVLIAGLPNTLRRSLTLAMFLYGGAAILASTQPFAESLIRTGKIFGVPPFFLVQWIAPLASEAPEFLIAGMFAFRGRTSLAIGTLFSAKINQWTLLVGLIPVVYSIAGGRIAALPMDNIQLHEVLLTSAQCIFAVVVIADMRFSIWDAALLAFLFFAQITTQMMFQENLALRTFFAIVYLALAVVLLVASRRRRQSMRNLVEPLRGRS